MRKSKKSACGSLYPGEELIWTGEPCPDKDHGKIDRWLVPLSGVMLALSAFFVVSLVFSVIWMGYHAFHTAAFVLALVMGGLSVYSYFFRFTVKRHAKEDLTYGLTSFRRVLIHDHAARRIYEYTPAQLMQAKITEIDKRGVGTIYLKPKRPKHLLDNTGLGFLAFGSGAHIALYDIPDCKKVYRLLKGKR